jgi:tRNA (mo5U34)-methyltransferase
MMHDTATVMRDIQALGPWFHNLHLPGGIETAPDHFLGDFPSFKWRQIEPHLPTDLSGARVLDIGCNAGFYSLSLAARGAEVLGIDTDEHYLAQARWAAELTGQERVTFRQASVYEVAHLGGRFDLVLFMGVFYHLRHPLLALDLIAELRPSLMVFQSLTFGGDEISPHIREDANFDNRERLSQPGWPAMAFIETTFCDDPTNWWVPNHAAVAAMLRNAGFEILSRPGHEIYICRFALNGADFDNRETRFAPQIAAGVGLSQHKETSHG